MFSINNILLLRVERKMRINGILNLVKNESDLIYAGMTHFTLITEAYDFVFRRWSRRYHRIIIILVKHIRV
jgi:hypothetical protein